MIEIDGSYGEGGGQIVRTALALSTITGKPFKVDKIRHGRCNSGLKNQHMFCIDTLEKLTNAKTKGAFTGSYSFEYEPGTIKGRTLSIDIETAGSITLLLQAVLLPCCFANTKTRLKIKGGTDVKWSMPWDYFKEILLPQLRRFADIDVKLLKRGYYPKGDGLVEVNIKPKFKLEDSESFDDFLKKLREENIGFDLVEQGHLIQIKGVSHSSKDLGKAEVSERQAKAAELGLNELGCPVNIDIEYSDSLCPGAGITTYAVFSKDKEDIDINRPIRIGSDSLGERGKKAEIVGKEAAERLVNEINYKAPVDDYLADNMIPWLALFGGKIKVAKISNHLKTNIYIVEKFLDVKFEIDESNKIISVL